MSSNAFQLTEQIFETIEKISENSIINSSIKYDQTLVCEIKSVEKKEQGLYTVFNQNYEFEAYTDKEVEYQVGDVIQVLIPQGDFSLSPKTILCKINTSEEQRLSRQGALKSFTALSNNLYSEIIEENVEEENGWYTTVISSFKTPSSLLTFNKLGLRFDIEYLLIDNEENVEMDKDYMIVINPIFCSDQTQASNFITKIYDDKQTLEKVWEGIGEENQIYFSTYNALFNPNEDNIFYIKTKHLDGNPFSYIVPTKQEFLFDISDLGYFCGARIQLAHKNLIKNKEQNIQDILKISNINFHLGEDFSGSEYETGENIILVPHTANNYPLNDKDKKLKQAISAIWFTKESNNEIDFHSEDNQDFSVQWFKNTLNTSYENPYFGYFWEDLFELETKYLFYEITWGYSDTNGVTPDRRRFKKEPDNGRDKYTVDSELKEKYYYIQTLKPVLNPDKSKKKDYYIRTLNSTLNSDITYLQVTDSYFKSNQDKSDNWIQVVTGSKIKQPYNHTIITQDDSGDDIVNEFNFWKKNLLEIDNYFTDLKESQQILYCHDKNSNNFIPSILDWDYRIINKNKDTPKQKIGYLSFYMPRFFYTTDNGKNFEPYSIEDIMDLFNYLNDIAPNKWYTASHMEVWSKTDKERTIEGYDKKEEYSCYKDLWKSIFGEGKQGCYSSKGEQVKYAGWLELRLWGEHPNGIDKIEINIPIIYKNINKLSVASSEINFNDDENTQIKAIVCDKENNIIAESNTLKYDNRNPVKDGSKTADLIKDLVLNTNDGSNGKYYIFNQVNQLNTSSKSISIKGSMNCIKSGDEGWDTSDITITWEVPEIGQSMLTYNEDTIKKSETIKFTVDDLKGYEVGDAIQKEFYLTGLSIKRTYSDAYTSNTIKCKVEKKVGNKVHTDEAEIELKFGRQGSSGTLYTFQINPIKGRDSFVISQTNSEENLDGFVALEATLTDQNGIDLNVSTLTTWSLLQTGKHNGETEYTPVSFWNYNKDKDKLINGEGDIIESIDDFPKTGDGEYDNSKFYTKMSETSQVGLMWRRTINENQSNPFGSLAATRDNWKPLSSTIVKAEVEYKGTGNNNVLKFEAYYAIPVTISRLYKPSAPSLFYFDHGGRALETNYSLHLNYDGSLINSTNIDKIESNLNSTNDLSNKITNYNNAIKKFESSSEENSGKSVFLKILNGAYNIGSYLEIKAAEDNGWSAIEANIINIDKIIKDVKYKITLDIFDIKNDAGEIESNLLTDTITSFNDWKKTYYSDYENSTWLQKLYDYLINVRNIANRNDAISEKEEYVKSNNELIGAINSAKGLGDSSYYWTIDVIDDDKNEFYDVLFKDQNATTIMNNYYYQFLNIPKIDIKKNSTMLILPSQFFDIFDIDDNKVRLVLSCYRIYNAQMNSQGNDWSYDSALVWSTPIRYFQDAYGFDYINEWDGSLYIDENNRRILSATMVAGTKDTANKFTGVIMGEISEPPGSTGSSIIPVINSGILGQRDGLDTFGFGTDGKAFIGTSEGGAIVFDGGDNQCWMASSTWLAGNGEKMQGICLDLKNGDAGFKGPGGSVFIQTGEEEKQIFTVKDQNDTTLFTVGSNNSYLQSSNYITGKSGFKFNIDSKDFYLRNNIDPANSGSGGITLSSGIVDGSTSPYLEITKNVPRYAKNLNLHDDVNGENEFSAIVDLFISDDGLNAILRDAKTDNFYVAKFAKYYENETTGEITYWTPKMMNIINKIDSSTWSIIWDEFGYNFFLKTLHLISSFNGSSINKGIENYNGNSFNYKNKNYKIVKLVRVNTEGMVISNEIENAGHFNSVAYDLNKKIIFATCGGRGDIEGETQNRLYVTKYNKENKKWEINKRLYLYKKELNNKGNRVSIGGTWEIAIEGDYLYALGGASDSDNPNYRNAYLYRYLLKDVYDELDRSQGEDKTKIRAEKEISITLYDNINIATYQGMEIHKRDNDLYAYFPLKFKDGRAEGPIAISIRKLNINSGTSYSVGNIKIDNILKDGNEEIEEVTVTDNNMYLSVIEPRTPYSICKIYQFTFNIKDYITNDGTKEIIDPDKSTIQLSDNKKFYALISDNTIKQKNFQGFTYDPFNKVFIHACRYPDSEDLTDIKPGRIILNYYDINKMPIGENLALYPTPLIEVSADKFYLKSSNYEIIENLQTSAPVINQDISSKTGTYFNLEDGKLFTVNADISGKITATSGKLGNFIIGNEKNGERLRSSFIGYGKYAADDHRYVVIRGGESIGGSGAIIFGLLHTGKTDLLSSVSDKGVEYEVNDLSVNTYKTNWVFMIIIYGTLGNRYSSGSKSGSSWSIERNGRAIFGRNIQSRSMQIYGDFDIEDPNKDETSAKDHLWNVTENDFSMDFNGKKRRIFIRGKDYFKSANGTLWNCTEIIGDDNPQIRLWYENLFNFQVYKGGIYYKNSSKSDSFTFQVTDSGTSYENGDFKFYVTASGISYENNDFKFIVNKEGAKHTPK